MSIDNKHIVITSAVRTAIGTFCGSLKDMQANDLGALVAKAAMKKSNLNAMGKKQKLEVVCRLFNR